jgi:hypothetical protein
VATSEPSVAVIVVIAAVLLLVCPEGVLLVVVAAEVALRSRRRCRASTGPPAQVWGARAPTPVAAARALVRRCA